MSEMLHPYLEAGYIVTVPDSEGPLNAFSAGRSEGYQTLDSVRATINFKKITLRNNTAVAGYGFSGGAQAISWAAALKHTYAPELNVTAWAFGGSLPNVTSFMLHTDGTSSAGYSVAALAGLTDAYPEFKKEADELLTKSGHDALDFARKYPIVDVVKKYVKASIFSGNFVKQDLLSSLFGKRNNAILYSASYRRIARQLTQGIDKSEVPDAPVFVFHSTEDEVAPYGDMKGTAYAWCQSGAKIRFMTYNRQGTYHRDTAVLGSEPAYKFIQRHIAGDHPLKHCSQGDNGSNGAQGDSGSGQPQGGNGSNQPHGGSGSGQPEGGNDSNQPQGGSGSNGSKGGNGSGQPQGGNDSNGSQGGNGSGQPEGGNDSNQPHGGSGSGQPEGGNNSNQPQGGSGSNGSQGGNGSGQPQGSNGSNQPQGGSGSNGSQGGNGSGQPQGGNDSNGSQGGNGPSGSRGGNGSNQPQGGNGSSGSQGGNDSNQPHGGSGSNHPQGGNDSNQPHGGSGSNQPQGGNDSNQPHGGNDSNGSQGGNNSNQPHGGSGSNQPQGGNDSNQPHGGNGSNQPQGGWFVDCVHDRDSFGYGFAFEHRYSGLLEHAAQLGFGFAYAHLCRGRRLDGQHDDYSLGYGYPYQHGDSGLLDSGATTTVSPSGSNSPSSSVSPKPTCAEGGASTVYTTVTRSGTASRTSTVIPACSSVQSSQPSSGATTTVSPSKQSTNRGVSSTTARACFELDDLDDGDELGYCDPDDVCGSRAFELAAELGCDDYGVAFWLELSFLVGVAEADVR
ncbi:hypothetical protein MOBT1_003001 [Malassezia obtusa]|uniref:triacylglycerol lipase n=1 Tax=Malassezia obtusa TaxID=76774 RepID=A0AAF0IT22_9BASI|nr:hypothetical protein MOBT1_003001 [Malassezia obtusa]